MHIRDFNDLSDFEKQLHDYRLTTVEILYHMPDHPKILQSYIWQELDLAPKFPVLKKFLDFWTREIEGKLHSIHFCTADLIMPAKWQPIENEFTMH